MSAQKRVLVGMSGGVDSSLSAALLKEQGFEVIGGFIKNWSDSKDLWTGECQWRAERRDAIRVAAMLGISLFTFNFEDQYRERIVQQLFQGYANGETPNPDVLCNEYIKFGLFLEEARRLRCDYIATGHYARVQRDNHGVAHLLRGRDPEKDQSYFLYRLPQSALAMALFPIGDLVKDEVRLQARSRGLPVADKPDSQGICFIGKTDMGAFLRQRIPSHPGEIVDPDGKVLGMHQGLDQYTIGQRHGIKIATGGNAWYVAEKDTSHNRLVIVPSDEHPLMFRSHALVHDLHWTRGVPLPSETNVEVQIRYRQSPINAQLRVAEDGMTAELAFAQPVKALAPGQSAVWYIGDECVGGGVIQASPV